MSLGSADGGGFSRRAASLGVCSWSLRASSPADLIEKVRETGCRSVQIHLDPIRGLRWRADDLGSRCRAAGISLISGMMTTKGEDYTTLETIKATGGIRPDATWSENLRAAEGNAIMAQRLGLPLVTFHAGFLPHEAGDPVRGRMIERLRQIADVFAARGVRVAFETGQESAETLLDVLRELERPAVGVNFDPANMILYGMGDPIEALAKLAPRVAQIHVKDAMPTKAPGTWGEEVRVGTGAVDWKQLFAVVRDRGLRVNCMIEREAGDDRVGDIAAARDVVRPLM
jgi:sugar phosphate isomerase/epimerase